MPSSIRPFLDILFSRIKSYQEAVETERERERIAMEQQRSENIKHMTNRMNGTTTDLDIKIPESTKNADNSENYDFTLGKKDKNMFAEEIEEED